MASLYDRRWRRERLRFLQSNPLCVYCLQQGKVEAASVVDHIKPHKGDRHLFWDRNNWQALCKPHHDSTKQAEERNGVVIGCGTDGIPLGGW